MFFTDIEEFRNAIDVDAIQLITSDSRRITEGGIFVAIKGHHNDGHRFIDNAKRSGAQALITESFVDCELPTLVVDNIRHEISRVAHELLRFDYPALTAVTGTNGKSSTATWIAECRAALGNRAAVIGTLGVQHLSAGFEEITGLTTPGAVETQSILARLDRMGTDSVTMEVSSHALDQGRVADLPFTSAHFTNLSRDHLDYHGTMDEYFNAKAKLFDWPSLTHRIVNVDDEYGAKLAQKHDCIGYGFGDNADIRAVDVSYLQDGLEFDVVLSDQRIRIKTPMLCEFNVYNLLGVIAQLVCDGFEPADIERVIKALKAVPGRMEQAVASDLSVYVDYAHTPEALTQVLESAKRHTDGQLWCVFGCGGDRDRGKRPEMARAVEASGAQAVLTSDNPRTEDPQQILDDAASGFTAKHHHIEADRQKAIEFAMLNASAGDVIVVAGKGHEDYIDINNKKVPWSEFSAIKSASLLRERRAQ